MRGGDHVWQGGGYWTVGHMTRASALFNSWLLTKISNLVPRAIRGNLSGKTGGWPWERGWKISGGGGGGFWTGGRGRWEKKKQAVASNPRLAGGSTPVILHFLLIGRLFFPNDIVRLLDLLIFGSCSEFFKSLEAFVEIRTVLMSVRRCVIYKLPHLSPFDRKIND